MGKELGVDKHQIDIDVEDIFGKLFGCCCCFFFGCIQQAGDWHGLRDGQTSDT